MRLVIVSNRLPITLVPNDGSYEFIPSAGGLATGLRSYVEGSGSTEAFSESIWVGWPGATVTDEQKPEVTERALKEHGSVPVYLSPEEMDKFYFGFCNRTIWALFHYFPTYAAYEEELWSNYQAVNKAFCDALLELLKPGDTVWIHDYHLMLLPQLLRQRLPHLPIGFFLHIPFPTYEIFCLFPRRWRTAILEGLLGSDLIGFHTFDYVQAFLRCVLRILGVEHRLGKILFDQRLVKVDSFPMGIDFEKFNQAAQSPEVLAESGKLHKVWEGTRVVLSLDRLDYSKGLLNRLKGFELFLQKYPEWHKKVQLLMIVIPSRVGVDQYDQIKKEIDETIGKINGSFAALDWTPIAYQFRTVPFEQLVALYKESDVMLVTPLRDGMNLIAKEYLASKPNSSGCLILSEMAGAAKELGEAIIINPTNTQEIAEALHEALSQSEGEAKKRNITMRKRLKRYDVVRWATDFLQSLKVLQKEQQMFVAQALTPQIEQEIIRSYQNASQRLLLLDYDGTLVRHQGDPISARPDDPLLQLLFQLCEEKNSTVAILSGRDRQTMETWFKELPCLLIAEHGVWFKKLGEEWELMQQVSNKWKQEIVAILEQAADRLPRAFVEEKEFTVALHYRYSDPELATIRITELEDTIVHLAATLDLQILHGDRVLEVRKVGLNKGHAGRFLLSKKKYDFILAIGNDRTDEDLFRAMPEEAFTIKVGWGGSHAKYSVWNVSDVRAFLKLITLSTKAEEREESCHTFQ